MKGVQNYVKFFQNFISKVDTKRLSTLLQVLSPQECLSYWFKRVDKRRIKNEHRS